MLASHVNLADLGLCVCECVCVYVCAIIHSLTCRCRCRRVDARLSYGVDVDVCHQSSHLARGCGGRGIASPPYLRAEAKICLLSPSLGYSAPTVFDPSRVMVIASSIAWLSHVEGVPGLPSQPHTFDSNSDMPRDDRVCVCVCKWEVVHVVAPCRIVDVVAVLLR